MAGRHGLARAAAGVRLLVCLAPLRSCAGEAADGIALVQASAQRHVQPPAVGLANGTLRDEDGCPTSDPREVFYGFNSSGGEEGEGAGSCGFGADRRSQSGEREVYFLRHAQPVCCRDCGLDGSGAKQCSGLKAHNRLLVDGALSKEAPVEVVYASPATRALETALRIFGDSGAPFVIEPRLVEAHGYSQSRHNVEEVIRQQRHPELQEQFDRIFPPPESQWDHLSGDPEGRVKSFTTGLLERPETRIAVVAHFHLLNTFPKLGMGCMEMGGVVVKASLASNGTWRLLSEGSCQGRRRRWSYGNYRRCTTEG
mmetsp:Transcript_95946/g.298755  ORF Transcript_95946/g.298755 Transcript_95946/m.298755 type:complete len:312 (-) Transcript_95946:28-963(-)